MFENYQVTYAGFWWRFLAHLLDGLILGVLFVPLGLGLGLALSSGGIDPDSPALPLANFGLYGFEILVTWLYQAFCESSSWQGTIGKKALGLRVTDMDGRRLSFGRATGRSFGKVLSSLICSIGFLMAAFTEKTQALHDMLASTLVLTGPAVPEYVAPPPPPDFSYRGGGPMNV